jgi:hypothetical protein
MGKNDIFIVGINKKQTNFMTLRFFLELFFFFASQALQRYGTDFTLINQLFPHRTRRELHAKFKKEEKMFPKRIEAALNFRKPLGFAFSAFFVSSTK